MKGGAREKRPPPGVEKSMLIFWEEIAEERSLAEMGASKTVFPLFVGKKKYGLSRRIGSNGIACCRHVPSVVARLWRREKKRRLDMELSSGYFLA